MNTLHYLRKMESVSLDVFYLEANALYSIISPLACFDRYLDADIGRNTGGIPFGEFIREIFRGNHANGPRRTSRKNSITLPSRASKISTSRIRIIVAITSVFGLIVFSVGRGGLCLLIMESTNRRGNSNYFPD